MELIKYFTQNIGKQIGPNDIVNMFRGGKTVKIKQKNWNTLPIYLTKKKRYSVTSKPKVIYSMLN